jgi:hypothetical protein
MAGGRSLLLAGVLIALAATAGAAWLHEIRPGSVVRPAAQTVNARAEKPQLPALTADEERFATALWAVQREATRSAVALSFAGITYQVEDRDARALARKIEPLAKFFHDAEMQVRAMSALRQRCSRDAEIHRGWRLAATPSCAWVGYESLGRRVARW